MTTQECGCPNYEVVRLTLHAHKPPGNPVSNAASGSVGLGGAESLWLQQAPGPHLDGQTAGTATVWCRVHCGHVW